MTVWNITPWSFDPLLRSSLMLGFICIHAFNPLMDYDKSAESNIVEISEIFATKKRKVQLDEEEGCALCTDPFRSPGFTRTDALWRISSVKQVEAKEEKKGKERGRCSIENEREREGEGKRERDKTSRCVCCASLVVYAKKCIFLDLRFGLYTEKWFIRNDFHSEIASELLNN